jgi:hypothetical protein
MRGPAHRAGHFRLALALLELVEAGGPARAVTAGISLLATWRSACNRQQLSALCHRRNGDDLNRGVARAVLMRGTVPRVGRSPSGVSRGEERPAKATGC